MSLLHNAKKHFILAIVFVLAAVNAISTMIQVINANATTFDEYKEAKQSAYVKVLIGYISRCFTKNFDVNSVTKENLISGVIDDGEWVLKDRIHDLSYTFLYGDTMNYRCEDISIKDAIDKIDDLVYGQKKTWPSDDEEVLRMNLKYFYKIKKEGLTQDKVIDCFMRRGDYVTSNCDTSALAIATDKLAADSSSGEDGTGYGFLQFILDKYKGFNAGGWINAYSDEELFFIASELERTLIDGYKAEYGQYYNFVEVAKNEYDSITPNDYGKRLKDGAIFYKVFTYNNGKPEWRYYKCYQLDGKANKTSYPAHKNGAGGVTWYTSYMQKGDETIDQSFSERDIFMDSDKFANMGDAIIAAYDAAQQKTKDDAKQTNTNAQREGCINTYIQWYNATESLLKEKGIYSEDKVKSVWDNEIPNPQIVKYWKNGDDSYTYWPASYVENYQNSGAIYKITYYTGTLITGTDRVSYITGVAPHPFTTQPINIDDYKDKATYGSDAEPCLYDIIVEKKFNPWLQGQLNIVAEKEKKQDVAGRYESGCRKLYKAWLDEVIEANGGNEMVRVGDGEHAMEYSENAKNVHQKINNALQKLFKGKPNAYGTLNDHSNWYDKLYIQPNARFEVARDWDVGGAEAQEGIAGEYGTCLACEYIKMSEEALIKYAPDIKFPAAGDSCSNPKPEDFDSDDDYEWKVPDFGDWTEQITEEYKDPDNIGFDDYGGYGDTSYEGDTYKPDTCYANSSSLGWITCPLISAATGIGKTMWSQIEAYHMKLPANALFGSTTSNEPGVHVAWRMIRDIANLVFIILFLIVVVSQVTGFGINNYGIKKILPKLIVCIMLVNLSYIICQIFVDLSNTVGSAIGNFLQGITEKIPWSIGEVTNADSGIFDNGFITGALIAGAAGGIIAIVMAGVHGDGPGALVGGLGLFVLGIVIVIVVAIATLYFTLIIREAAVVICITIAPLAIVCNTLPNLQPLYKKWLSLMKALLTLYPLSAFVVGGGQLAGAVLASTGLNTMRIAAAIVQVVPYFFIPSLLRKSLAGIGNVGARLGALGKSMGHKASNGAKNGIKNSKRYQEMLAGSKFKAEGRYNASKYKRNTRRQQRLEAERDENGGTLSRSKTEQLNKLMEENRKYDAAQKDAKTNTQAGMYAAMIARDDANREANTITTALTYGGAQTDNKGNIIRDKNGNIVFDQKRGEEYTAGVMFNKTLNARKDADDNINHARHAENLFQAGVKKSAIDRDIQTRTAEAFVVDYDEQGRPVYDKNGNVIEDVVMDSTGKPVIDPTTGKPQTKPRKAAYTGKAYTENYRQSQESKLNSTLASGYVPRQKTTLSGAIESAQNTASNEIGKQAEADYTEKQKSELDKIAESTVNNIATNYRDPGIIESAEALIRVQSARGQEDKAINTFKGINKNLQLEYDKTERDAKVARDAGRIEEADALDAKCAEIQKCADSFNQKMASSPIKLVSMMAKQIEGTSMSSDTTAHLDANGKTTANGANYDLDKYIQSAMFKNYTDQKGASLVFDKDSNKYLAQAAKDAGININIDTKHIIEQMSASNQPESSINSLKTVLEEKINAAKVAAPAGSTPAPVFSENLSSDVLTKLNAATIEVMTTSAGDLDNMKRMLGSMTPEQRGKLTDAQISAYQKIDSTFMAGSNNNQGGSNNGGFNYSEEGGFGADDAAY